MSNDEEVLAGASLPRWFKGSVRSLGGIIRLAAEAGGSVDTAVDNATIHLGDLRNRAARDTVGFTEAARAVLFAIQELDTYTGRTHVNAPGYSSTVGQLKADAVSALRHLVELLRTAEPSESAKALFID
ncbi:hypothetical protein [Methylobacterium radiotolerans]|uniref:hypothetical protein n=1 Tax=Methylobacterium radiotolerans TaxID=31998 RepID=UPI0011BF32B9|nr:hypothetical protein [Methylobacterium radiotolerans]